MRISKATSKPKAVAESCGVDIESRAGFGFRVEGLGFRDKNIFLGTVCLQSGFRAPQAPTQAQNQRGCKAKVTTGPERVSGFFCRLRV